MKFQMHFFIVISVVVALAACAPPGTQEPEPAAEEPPSTEADVEAINKLEEEWSAGFNRADTDYMATMVTDDLVTMPPNSPAIVGKEASMSWWKNTFAEFTFETTVSQEEVVVAGDWAFVRATSTGTATPKAGGQTEGGAATYVHIMHRQPDGSWKLARDIWNSDNPPPGS